MSDFAAVAMSWRASANARDAVDVLLADRQSIAGRDRAPAGCARRRTVCACSI
jgi:hypothetical protein